VFIKVEPAGFFMYTVQLIFDLEGPDSEDHQVRDYLAQHELEPKYQWNAEVESRQCELMQFGGCYLGRHLEAIGQIQRRAVEVELLTAEVEQHLDALSAEERPSTEEQRRTAVTTLVEELHQESAFQTDENGELIAVLAGDAVREAARRLLTGSVGP